jgi:hypothetical protein
LAAKILETSQAGLQVLRLVRSSLIRKLMLKVLPKINLEQGVGEGHERSP